MNSQPNADEPSSDPPITPEALFQAGFTHLREGRPFDAQVCCLQALAIEADHADTLHLMGLLSLQGGQHDHAVEWLTRAVRKDPRTDYLATLGIALKQMGRAEEALKVFDKAVQLKPGDAELWKHLGGCLLALDRSAEALLSYQHALHLDGGQCARQMAMGACSVAQGQLRGWMGGARGPLERTGFFARLSQIFATEMARPGSRGRQDHPGLRR